MFFFIILYFINLYQNLEKLKINSNIKGSDLRFTCTPKKYETMLVEFKIINAISIHNIKDQLLKIFDPYINIKEDSSLKHKKINKILRLTVKNNKYQLLDNSYLKQIIFETDKDMLIDNNFWDFVARSPLNCQIAINTNSKILYFYGYHGLHDGLKLLNLVKDIGLVKYEKINYKLLKFKYKPFQSELIMLKSLYDIYNIKKSELTKRVCNRTFKPKIINYSFNFKELLDIQISINIKIIGIILYSLMDENKYNSLNVAVTVGINSIESQRNQSSIIVINVKYNSNIIYFIKQINKKINNYKYQSIGLYFASTFNNINKYKFIKEFNKKKIDITIGSLPVTKSYFKIFDYDTEMTVYNPYHITPMYSLNYIKEKKVYGYISIKYDDNTLYNNILSSKLLDIK